MQLSIREIVNQVVRLLSKEKERELIESALAGNQQAYRELFDAHRGAVNYIVSQIVRSPEEVKDLVQETFIKAFSSLKSYRFEFRFSTWLYKIAANNSIDHLRKRKLNSYSLDRPIETKKGQVAVELPDYRHNPERDYRYKITKKTIKEAIDSLPPKYKEVIALRHQQNLSYEDIADYLQLPLGTIKARIFRARELLKKKLKGWR